VEALSSNPILFTQFPPLATVLAKFSDSINNTASTNGLNKDNLIGTLNKSVLPYLSGLEANRTGKSKTIQPAASPVMLNAWTQATHALATGVPTAQLFPLIDLWRMAMLDPAVTTWLSALLASSAQNPLFTILTQVSDALANPSAQTATRNTILTTLRLLANAIGAPSLSVALCSREDARTRILEVLVPSLLHDDAQVRTAAASLAFNVAAVLQRRRVERVQKGISNAVKDELDGEWEVEAVSAVIEAIQRETQSEDVGKCGFCCILFRSAKLMVELVHRLVASLAYFLRLSPVYEDEVSPLLEVLQAKDTLKTKISEGPVKKSEVKKLVEEVATKLCP
jgi:hypothetical protein